MLNEMHRHAVASDFLEGWPPINGLEVIFCLSGVRMIQIRRL